MSAFNSPRSSHSGVVGVDDVAVARSVIRAMRSSANSSRHYKQNATRDDHIISDICQFNKIVSDKSEEISKNQSVEQQMNEAMANFIPGKLATMTILNSPTEQKFREDTKHMFEEDSDSDEDEYTKDKKAAQRNKRDQTYHLRDHTTVTGKGLAPPKADFNFDSDGDDDPSEMAELMQNFVAPNSSKQPASTSSTNLSQSGKVGKVQAYKGQSSNTSSSIRFGAGGIRGIQHQSIHRDQADYDNTDEASVVSANTTHSATHSVGGSSAATASKLMHIKPGQAIRVKAPSKKSRSSAHSEVTGQGVGGFSS